MLLAMSRAWIAWVALGILGGGAGCHRQKEGGAGDEAGAARCNSDRIARMLRRLDERPPLPLDFVHPPSNLRSAGAPEGPQLVARSGPPAKALGGAVIRVVRGGIYVVGDDHAVAPGGRMDELPEARPLVYGELQPLGAIAAAVAPAKGDVALAIDADAPGSLVYIALSSAATSGASRVRLLFEMKDPTPPPTPPAGAGDPDHLTLEAVAVQFAKSMQRCPDAGKAFSEPLARGDAAGGIRALAAALPRCPCDLDMDTAEAAAAAASGELALTAAPLHLTADASAGTRFEIPLEAPWSKTAGPLLEAGRKTPVHLVLPPPPPPPPLPPMPRKRKRH